MIDKEDYAFIELLCTSPKTARVNLGEIHKFYRKYINNKVTSYYAGCTGGTTPECITKQYEALIDFFHKNKQI